MTDEITTLRTRLLLTMLASRGDLAQHDAASSEKQRTATLAELTEAIAELVAALEVSIPGCGLCAASGRCSPVMVQRGGRFVCDEHASALDDPADLLHASALRRARSLLAQEGR